MIYPLDFSIVVGCPEVKRSLLIRLRLNYSEMKILAVFSIRVNFTIAKVQEKLCFPIAFCFVVVEPSCAELKPPRGDVAEEVVAFTFEVPEHDRVSHV